MKKGLLFGSILLWILFAFVWLFVKFSAGLLAVVLIGQVFLIGLNRQRAGHGPTSRHGADDI